MGLGTLAQVLRPLQEAFPAERHPDLLVGLDGADDAAVYRLTDDIAIIQTLDFFPPVVDDPFVYGQIAAANAMSDVYAMGGEVRLALNIAAFPEDLDPGILAEILRGGADKVAEAGGVIAGGHTVIDVEPKYGLSVMGVVHPSAMLRTAGALPGDALLLTKPIGTGILLTAAKQQLQDSDGPLAAAIESMRRLTMHDAHLARAGGAHAVTDVTGFGLVGHAAEIAERSGVEVELELEALPLLPEARRFAELGAVTGGGGRNLEQLGDTVQLAADTSEALRDLLYDPQTSGGLLIAVAETDAELLRARIEATVGGCWRIGSVLPAETDGPLVVVR